MKWDIPQRQFSLQIFYGRDQNKLKLDRRTTEIMINSKIVFDTSASVSGGVNELNLVIYGLSVAEMQEITTSISSWSNPIIYNKIELYAGYDNKALIFSGNIIEAKPNLNNANYSVEIRALSNFSQMLSTIKTYSFNGDVSVLSICQEFAKDLNFILLQGKDLENIKVSNYFYENHSIVENIRYLAMITGLEIYTEYNAVIIKKPAQPIKNKKEIEINEKNLIGVVKPTTTGFECDIRLDPFIRTAVSTKLKNISFERLNDPEYTIMSFSHHGDTRGNVWKTHLWCINQNYYKDRKYE